MKKTQIYTMALVAAVLCSTISLARQNHDREQTIECESQSGRYAYCRTHTTGIVELRKQLSKTPCKQYDTWGADSDGSGVWVRDGCRAVFAVREQSWSRRGRDDDWHRGGERTIECESQSGRSAYCRTYTAGTVELRKQLSKAPCKQYDTWGADRDGGGVWVRDGCRAVFAVRSSGWRDRDDDRYGGSRTIRCASKNWAYNHCDVPGGPRGARLVRQISGTRCERNDNWGEDRYGIWVDRGCEGEFDVGR